jgi:hypothetical protein
MANRESPNVHICIVQPPGYRHSMALLDPARYFQYQFARLGARATMAKNRLRSGVPNLVFGAHLGLDPSMLREYACVLVNLEQLGTGGSQWSAQYLELLRTASVIDYHPANPAAYGRRDADVPIVRFGHAPYLAAGDAPGIPIAERPIDLLFFGSINDRRRRIFERIESTGRAITLFDGPIYGPERDAFVRQSRAVLNCHFYESARFEQVRAFQVLSLGTPLVSETSPDAASGAGFEECVSWFDDGGLEDFFSGAYASQRFSERARAQLARFEELGAPSGYDRALEQVLHARALGGGATLPAQRWIHVGGGADYRTGWLNLSPDPADQADLALDLRRPLTLPHQGDSAWRGPVALQEGATDLVLVSDFPESAQQARALLGNCLAVLRPGGLLVVDRALPAGIAAERDESWVATCTAEFWRMGWLEHRLQERERAWCDAGGTAVPREQASMRRIKLEKVATSIAERTLARCNSADFCGLASAPIPDLTRPGAPHEPASAGVAAAIAPATASAGASAGASAVAAPPEKPVVEVICVAYRRYGPLRVLVQSWLNQSATNWRLRVIHDGADAEFERIMIGYVALAPDRISYHQTATRHNDYGHSLREMGLREASGDYVLLTNDDNYYVPRFLEFVNEAISQGRPEVVMYDMVHSHDHPGLRPLPAYSYFQTQYSRGNIDMGAAIVRGDLARLAGFRDHTHDGDATYFEDVARAAGKVTVAKIPRVLFVHN